MRTVLIIVKLVKVDVQLEQLGSIPSNKTLPQTQNIHSVNKWYYPLNNYFTYSLLDVLT